MNNFVIGLKRFFTNKNVVTVLLIIVILAVLYRDFWATENERKYLHQKEKEELIKLEKIKQEKYSYTNLFQNKNTLNQINLENRKSLIVKENMLRRILNKIKRFFRLGVN